MQETFFGLTTCEWLMVLALANIAYFGFKFYKIFIRFLLNEKNEALAIFSPTVLLVILYFSYGIYNYGLLNFCFLCITVIIFIICLMLFTQMKDINFNVAVTMLSIIHTITLMFYTISFMFGVEGLAKIDVVLAVILAFIAIFMIILIIVAINDKSKGNYQNDNSSNSNSSYNSSNNSSSTNIQKTSKSTGVTKTSSSRDLTLK